MKTNITIPDDLWVRAKACAAERKTSLADIVCDALSVYMGIGVPRIVDTVGQHERHVRDRTDTRPPMNGPVIDTDAVGVGTGSHMGKVTVPTVRQEPARRSAVQSFDPDAVEAE